jgi:hypothetical protein
LQNRWRRRADDAPTPWAPVVATALTAAVVVAISVPLASSHLRLRARTTWTSPPHREPVIFLMPARPHPLPPPALTRRSTGGRPSVEAEIPPAPAPVAGAASAPRLSPPRDSSHARPAAHPTLPLTVDRDNELGFAVPTARVGPLLGPVAIPRFRPLTAIGQDSARRALGADVPRLALTRKPSQEQVDEQAREQARGGTAMWESHRPVALPMAGGGVSVPFPLFAAGPSPAQRKRDSIVNADNLRRLHRMLEFARARLDSICRTDSLARKSSQCRGRAQAGGGGDDGG